MPKLLPTILLFAIVHCGFAQQSSHQDSTPQPIENDEQFNAIYLKVDVFSELSYSTGFTNPYYQNLGFGLSASMQFKEFFSVGASYARTNLEGNDFSIITYTADDYRLTVEGGLPIYKSLIVILNGSMIGQVIHERTCLGGRCDVNQSHLLFDLGRD